MLKAIEEFNANVLIAGFRNIRIHNTEEFLKAIINKRLEDSEVQFFDAKLVATWQHLYFAALNAMTSFEKGESISKSLSMEAMLYASAQHQISKATDFIGIKPDTKNLAVLIIGEKAETLRKVLLTVQNHVKVHPDESVLELTKEKHVIIKQSFEITDLELETARKNGDGNKALVDLVIERMALLSTQS